MSITITKVNGKLDSILVTEKHVMQLLRSIDNLIDVYINASQNNIDEIVSFSTFQSLEENQSLFLLMKEY